MSRPTLSIDFSPEIQAATATHTVSELSRASGVPRTTVRRMIARGNVPSLTAPLTSGDWSSIVKRVQYLGGRTTRLVGPAPDRGPIELQITPAIIHQVGPVEQARMNADAAAINRNRRIADRPGPVEAIEPQPAPGKFQAEMYAVYNSALGTLSTISVEASSPEEARSLDDDLNRWLNRPKPYSRGHHNLASLLCRTVPARSLAEAAQITGPALVMYEI